MMKNRSKITIKGLNQERMLNSIVKSVRVFNFKRCENNVSHFEVEFKDRNKVRKLLSRHNIQILSFTHSGVLNSILQLLKSYGVIVALLLSVAVYALQYNFILKIEIFGVKDGLRGQIAVVVEDSLDSKLKGQIDTIKIENLVREQFDEISSVSVAIIGQSLVVNINQVDVPEEMEDAFLPLVSQYDGRIVKIQLIQGTLAVNEGDIIKQGDILVYPYIFDSQGQKINTVAKAEIYADVWLVGEEKHYDHTIKTIRTGASIQKNEVYLNQLLIYSSQASQTFQQFEVECKLQPLTKNLILPLYLKKLILYETKTIEIIEEFNNVREKIIKNAREKALIFLQENEIIKEESFTIREGSGWHQVNYVITLEKKHWRINDNQF